MMRVSDMPIPTPGIGIITDTKLQFEPLHTVVADSQCCVKVSYCLHDIAHNMPDAKKVQAWLVHVQTSREQYTPEELEAFYHWISELTVPVILSEECNAKQMSLHQGWGRQLRRKLLILAGELNTTEISAPEYIWVLGASAGGTQPVKDFLSALPACDNLAFIYAQHIDSFQHKTLVDAINRDTQYQCLLPEHGHRLASGEVLMVPSDYTIELVENGTVIIDHTRSWRGDYKPSIDQVAANIARVFQTKAGLIVFSGMGDDGALGARLMAMNRAPVWVQTPSGCQVSSMPESCIQTDVVSVQDDPSGLAKKLAVYSGHKSWLVKKNALS